MLHFNFQDTLRLRPFDSWGGYQLFFVDPSIFFRNFIGAVIFFDMQIGPIIYLDFCKGANGPSVEPDNFLIPMCEQDHFFLTFWEPEYFFFKKAILPPRIK